MADRKDILHCRPINLHGNLCGADDQVDGGVTVLSIVNCPECLVMADMPGCIELVSCGLAKTGPSFRQHEKAQQARNSLDPKALVW